MANMPRQNEKHERLVAVFGQQNSRDHGSTERSSMLSTNKTDLAILDVLRRGCRSVYVRVKGRRTMAFEAPIQETIAMARVTERDEDHDYTRADLALMPRTTLIDLIIEHQQARWFERVGSRGTLQTFAHLQSELAEAERELEHERRECARLRDAAVTCG
jgi:hypothetical protein